MGLFSRNKNVTPKGRIPVEKIKNDWDTGFQEGYPLWQKGESERKAGNIEKAIDFYDRARNVGYLAPALYKSYAMAYRKLKDTDNEILILEEGIKRMASAKGNYKTGLDDLREQLKKAKMK